MISSTSLLLPLFPLTVLLLLLLPPHLNANPSSHCNDAQAIPAPATRLLNSYLSNLVSRSTYFSVFSVALDKPCPFWQSESPQCVMRECSVKDCPETDVPPAWKSSSPSSPIDCHYQNVDRSLTGLAALVGQPLWEAADNAAWTIRDDHARSLYVDLRSNPEQYTGYAGESSARVWQAVYDENCFTFSDKCRSGICDLDTCKEERVLYRLISGLHASITMHIARRYLHSNHVWGPNIQIYKDRLRPYPERLANLDVTYALVLRAVSKASSALHPLNYTYITGNHENDHFTATTLDKVFRLPLLRPQCEDKVFDESDMFIQNNQYMLPEFRSAFRNISMIMDCVGCEKCRLWGKLQFLGLGTALRILFEDEIPELERNDVIALVNLLYKLSTSVKWAAKMEDEVKRDARIKAKAGGVLIGLVILLMAYLYGESSTRPPNAKAKKSTHVSKEHTAAEVDKVDDTAPELSIAPSDRTDESTPKPVRANENEMNSPSGTGKTPTSDTPLRRSGRLRKRAKATPG